MKKLIVLPAIIVLLFAMQSSALAIVGFGPRLGYYKTQDAEDGHMLAGAGVRFKLFSLGVEGSIDYRSEDLANGAVSVRSWPVMVSALIYPLPIAYGIAGMGWYNTTFDYNQAKLGLAAPKDKTEQKVGYHIGGGVQLPLGGATLAGDIRYVFLNYDFTGLPNNKNISSNFYAITVSVLFGL